MSHLFVFVLWCLVPCFWPSPERLSVVFLCCWNPKSKNCSNLSYHFWSKSFLFRENPKRKGNVPHVYHVTSNKIVSFAFRSCDYRSLCAVLWRIYRLRSRVSGGEEAKMPKPVRAWKELYKSWHINVSSFNHTMFYWCIQKYSSEGKKPGKKKPTWDKHLPC